MTHHATAKFWRFYGQLPPEIQRLADKSFALLKNDPSRASLHFKKVGRYWSARIGSHYRALAVSDGDALVWFWIGRHDEYERIIAH